MEYFLIIQAVPKVHHKINCSLFFKFVKNASYLANIFQLCKYQVIFFLLQCLIYVINNKSGEEPEYTDPWFMINLCGMSYLVIFLYSFSKHYHVFLSKISRKIYQFLIYVKDNIPVEKLGYTNVWFAIKDPWKVLLGNFFVFIFHFPIFKIFQSSTMSQNFRIW